MVRKVKSGTALQTMHYRLQWLYHIRAPRLIGKRDKHMSALSRTMAPIYHTITDSSPYCRPITKDYSLTTVYLG